MNNTLLNLLELGIWSAIAAVGFGLLFNIPKRAILTVFLLGFGSCFIKFSLIFFHFNVVFSSFMASLFIGILSTPLAHRIHQPPVVFSIPSVIPMIPGYYAYETILSIMQFTLSKNDAVNKIELISAIFSNGFTMIFILFSITIGVSFPLLVLRKSTIKKRDN